MHLSSISRVYTVCQSNKYFVDKRLTENKMFRIFTQGSYRNKEIEFQEIDFQGLYEPCYYKSYECLQID